MENPKLQYLPHIGYVSLYPFLLHLLPVDSSYLHNILDQLTDSELLWSNYGIRSLAKSSAFYNKRNTEHDPPYWRGAIWIHFNYLALRALHHYHSESNDTRLKERLMSAYSDLRFNVISNVERVFKETNTVWEQYNDIDGHGQYSSSFTGWSALVLLIKDELY
ncbi:hypothetical protein GJ496_006428 [Pomphorhynchus laevis]|nr:hypothetical protein GJ496_006428 [Pomphorhynchus laevis]